MMLEASEEGEEEVASEEITSRMAAVVASGGTTSHMATTGDSTMGEGSCPKVGMAWAVVASKPLTTANG